MPLTVTLEEAKTSLEKLLKRVSSGEELVIVEDGEPRARLITSLFPSPCFQLSKAVLERLFTPSDPFDRLLVVQARVEGLVLVTHDQQIGRYDVDALWT